jgi:hypothetical protein
MNEPFRLHPGTLLEGDIQGQIIAYLRHEQARGRVVWFERSNGGGGRVAGRSTDLRELRSLRKRIHYT